MIDGLAVEYLFKLFVDAILHFLFPKVRTSTMQDVNVVPTVSSTTSSSSASLVSVVVVCMTIMAVCALVYFAIRCYFDERRWRASAMLCKCLPPASAASLVECGNPCRYVEVSRFPFFIFIYSNVSVFEVLILFSFIWFDGGFGSILVWSFSIVADVPLTLFFFLLYI